MRRYSDTEAEITVSIAGVCVCMSRQRISLFAPVAFGVAGIIVVVNYVSTCTNLTDRTVFAADLGISMGYVSCEVAVVASGITGCREYVRCILICVIASLYVTERIARTVELVSCSSL